MFKARPRDQIHLRLVLIGSVAAGQRASARISSLPPQLLEQCRKNYSSALFDNLLVLSPVCLTVTGVVGSHTWDRDHQTRSSPCCSATTATCSRRSTSGPVGSAPLSSASSASSGGSGTKFSPERDLREGAIRHVVVREFENFVVWLLSNSSPGSR